MQIMVRRQRWLAFLIVSLQCSTSIVWNPEQFNFYDRIRLVDPEDAHAETHSGSNVVGVQLRNVNSSQTEAYRLCHLSSVTAVTHGRIARHLISHRGSVLLAVLHFNAKSDTVVPDLQQNQKIRNCNVKLTFDFDDTKFSPISTSRIFMSKIFNHSIETSSPCAISGATISPVSALLARLSSAHSIPVVSHTSTATHLDNKDVYGLFGRTVPTDKGYAIAALKYYWEVLGVTHCGVIYEKNEWGIAFFTEFIQAKTFLFPDMNVVSVSYDPDSKIIYLLDAIYHLHDTGYNYFFGILTSKHYDPVMREAYRIGLAGGDKVWLWTASGQHFQLSGYTYDASTEGDLANATSGSLFVTTDVKKNKAFDKEWATLENDSALKEYFMSKQPEPIRSSNFTFVPSADDWIYFQYDAVMALGMAMCEAGDDFFSGESLFDAFRKIAFRGASGLVAFDHMTGTRDVGTIAYKIYNILQDVPNEKGEIAFVTTEVARQHSTSYVNGHRNRSAMRWKILSATTYADGGSVPPPVLPPRIWRETNMIQLPVRIVGLSLAGVTIFASTVFACWTIHFRHDVGVRSSQPEFLLMLCSGTCLMASSIIPQSLQEPISQKGLDRSCVAAPWLFSLGFVVSFSALFSKTARIYKIVKYSHRCRRVKLRIKDVLLPFAILLACNMVVLVLWTTLSPLEWQRTATGMFSDQYGRQVESYGRCAPQKGHSAFAFVTLMVSINVSCLLYALFQSYRARKLPTEYNVSYYMALSFGSILQALMFGIPILFAVGQKPGAFFLTKALLISLICFAILIPLFLPKMRVRRMLHEKRNLKTKWKSERKWGVELYTKNKRLKREIEKARASQGGSRCTTEEVVGAYVI